MIKKNGTGYYIISPKACPVEYLHKDGSWYDSTGSFGFSGGGYYADLDDAALVCKTNGYGYSVYKRG
jgi:hypothetical protein